MEDPELVSSSRFLGQVDDDYTPISRRFRDPDDGLDNSPKLWAQF